MSSFFRMVKFNLMNFQSIMCYEKGYYLRNFLFNIRLDHAIRMVHDTDQATI
jgi:hypothetical protein